MNQPRFVGTVDAKNMWGHCDCLIG
jgi:hypothetical protein